MKKKLVLLGASGSIGVQTLDVILQHPDRFELKAFGVGKNIEKCRDILRTFDVPVFAVERQEDCRMLQKEYPGKKVLWGEEGLIALSESEDYDVLVNALVGFAGFVPTMHALYSSHDVALANKETLVVGGELVRKALAETGRKLLPIDSEHSAIFQCLQGNRASDVARLIITASGGAFRNRTRAQLKDVTVEQALAHPNWSMGAKITVDSATMMNKGFEVMEAHYLFDLPYEQITVLMHDESMIHSMVEYRDHSFIAQLGSPDMRLPIQYALTWPERLDLQQDHEFDLAEIGTLHFHHPDTERYPLLALAYEAGRRGGTLPAVMNGANEEANLAFREGRLPFLGIEEMIIGACRAHDVQEVTCTEDLT
ncbi:MAG: 1-deoxy-D-xylulose-5-phosphate reductoisomerase, partial [Solobacterium sp.]|nr:1-deoxy-D-xylulose-5-phosphate reductoisomerase [Solobacterium sp.]